MSSVPVRSDQPFHREMKASFPHLKEKKKAENIITPPGFKGTKPGLHPWDEKGIEYCVFWRTFLSLLDMDLSGQYCSKGTRLPTDALISSASTRKNQMLSKTEGYGLLLERSKFIGSIDDEVEH